MSPPSKGQEQNASEGAVDVWQRDQHESATRPDMKCMRFENMPAVGRRRNGQLFVAVVEVLLREVEARQFEHLSANSRSSTIGSNHNFGIDNRLGSRVAHSADELRRCGDRSRCSVH